MAYIAANVKEDAQDDTLRFLASVIWNASDAIRRRDPELLYTECNIAYMTFKARMNPEQRKQSEGHRTEVRGMLYGDNRARNTREMSGAFNSCMLWYELLCEYLTEQGILLRMEANLDEIVARRTG